MKKFTCGHCGGRLAVNPRHLGQLVHCPECARPTHPLAGDILAAARDAGPATRALSAEPVSRACENCGRSIGQLEKLRLWDNHLVCEACHDRLAPAPSPPPPPTARRSRKKATSLLPAPSDPPAGRKALPAPTPAGPVLGADRARSPAALLPAPPDRAPAPAAPTAAADPVIPVAVTRAAAATYAAVPPLVRQRVARAAAGLLVAGLTLYGLLTLLRDLMGFLLTAALVIVGAAVGLAAVRVGSAYVRRWVAAARGRRTSRTTPADTPPPS